MSDYATQLHAAQRHLDEFTTLWAAVPQEEGLAPVWLTTPEGLAFLDALHRGADDEALAIYDQAYGRALNAWSDLLWQAPWPAKEDAR